MSDEFKHSADHATATAAQSVDSAARQLQNAAGQATAQVRASLSDQPFAILGIAALAGFVVGAIWKS